MGRREITYSVESSFFTVLRKLVDLVVGDGQRRGTRRPIRDRCLLRNG